MRPGGSHAQKNALSTTADITGSGAAVQIATTGAARWIQITTPSANAAVVRFGDSNVSATRGASIAPGGGQFLPPFPVVNTPSDAFYTLSTIYRATFNGSLRTGWKTTVGADALADFASDPTIGPDSAASGALWNSDGIHPLSTAHIIAMPYLAAAIQQAASGSFNIPVLSSAMTPTTVAITGCGTISSQTTQLIAGSFVGSFVTNTTGTCAAAFALPTALHGWVCNLTDVTKHLAANIMLQSVASSTGCTVTGTTAASDVLTFALTPQ